MSARWINRGLDALTWLVLAIMLAPIGWLVVSSLQTDGQLSTGAYDLLYPTFTAFSRMWESVDFERYLINSLIICTVAALLATAFASLAGYALARFRFRGSAALSLGVVGTQLIPGSLFLLPVFMGFIWLKQNTPIHLFDTHLGMILVYTAFFTPVAIYFMRYFFAAIPKDLEEAAMVDGCTRLTAFLKIVLPAAAPGLVATFVYAFLFAWDELLFVAALTQANAETIPVGIRNFIGIAVTLIAGLIVGAQRDDSDGPIDLIIHNGTVYSAEASAPWPRPWPSAATRSSGWAATATSSGCAGRRRRSSTPVAPRSSPASTTRTST